MLFNMPKVVTDCLPGSFRRQYVLFVSCGQLKQSCRFSSRKVDECTQVDLRFYLSGPSFCLLLLGEGFGLSWVTLSTDLCVISITTLTNGCHVETPLCQECANGDFSGKGDTTNPLKRLAPSTGVEPVTYRLGGGCSILLSYEGRGAQFTSRLRDRHPSGGIE